MKKIFSFAIVAAVVGMMASCGNKTNTPTDGVDSVVAEPEVHDRWGADYQVTLPAGWVVDEYAAEMIVKNEAKGLKLNFREFPGANFDNCVKNSGGNADNKAEDVVADNEVVWQVYQTNRDEYNTCYLGKMPNDEVIIVWASPEDPANADVHEIIKSVALK